MNKTNNKASLGSAVDLIGMLVNEFAETTHM